jgi:hypothetical protein
MWRTLSLQYSKNGSSFGLVIRIRRNETDVEASRIKGNSIMGQQQLLLILLGVIIIGAAIVLALNLMSAQSIQSNKDAIINDLNHIAAHAYQYRISSSSLAGGGGKYTGYHIPNTLASNENASYTSTVTPDEVTLTAISANNPNNTIVAKIDGKGSFIPNEWAFAGDFQ